MSARAAVLAFVCAAAVCAASACAPTYAPGYEAAFAAGLRAKNAGRLDEAAARFDEAAKRADRYKDREEARLLLAETYRRLGKPKQAAVVLKAIVDAGEGRYHAVRAEFLLADLTRSLEGDAAGDAATERAAFRFPESGLTRHALRREVERIEADKGKEPALAKWTELLGRAPEGSSLYEQIAYERALLLFRMERFDEAERLFLETARAYPYPKGSLTDDAFYQASLLRERRGDIDGAIAVLEEMLAVTEKAYVGSSYDRPRFPQGQIRIAVLYRDGKKDPARAIDAFERLIERHPSSRFVDDALFAIARLRSDRGDAAGACGAFDRLREQRADSRYVRCGSMVCATAPRGDRDCPEYVTRDANVLTPGRAPDPFGPATLPQ